MARGRGTPRSEFRRSARRERYFQQVRRGLGQIVREHREALELTQEEAAERVGVHPVTYARIERGELNPTLATLCAVAYAYNIDLQELLPALSRR